MSTCIIFGGAGYIGTHLAKHFLESGKFSHVHIADIRTSSLVDVKGISTSITDVRHSIPNEIVSEHEHVSLIVNLAAVHREPGHNPKEYFETNVNGAVNVCDYAEKINCPTILFTSSISIYGPTHNPTTEDSLPCPSTPYGASKYPAELIHKSWFDRKKGRKLIIVRPGVVYGPGDPGNILRMIKAVRKGYFIFPGSKNIHKSYAYIYGLIASIDFILDSDRELTIYNYVETPTDTIVELSAHIKEVFKCRAPIFSVPSKLLQPLAAVANQVLGSKNPLHPVRVKKAATPTHIVPKVLLDLGFNFRYDFKASIQHWLKVAPQDFNANPTSAGISPLVLKNS